MGCGCPAAWIWEAAGICAQGSARPSRPRPAREGRQPLLLDTEGDRRRGWKAREGWMAYTPVSPRILLPRNQRDPPPPGWMRNPGVRWSLDLLGLMTQASSPPPLFRFGLKMLSSQIGSRGELILLPEEGKPASQGHRLVRSGWRQPRGRPCPPARRDPAPGARAPAARD